MSKRDKRKGALRRDRVRTKPTLKEAPPPRSRRVKVAVVTSPQWRDGNPSLRHDVDLVKAAVLYADEVELLGLAASMVHSIGIAPESRGLTLTQIMALSESANGPFMPPHVREVLPRIEKARKSGKLVPVEARKFMDEADQMVREANDKFRVARDEVIATSEAEELRPAIDRGVLRVPDLDVGMERAVAAAGASRRGLPRADNTAEVQRWVDEVTVRLNDRTTRLLFDEEAGEVVAEALEQGRIRANQIGLRLAGKAAVGAGLVARLPAFTEAPMDELLDVRDDLDGPLGNYRSAVSRFSDEIPAAIGPDLDYEVDHLWEKTVAPALTEMDDLFHQHSFVRELARTGGMDVARYMALAGGVYIGLGAASDLGQVAASLMGAAPGAIEATTRASLARSAAQRQVRQHELFYLHQLRRRIT